MKDETYEPSEAELEILKIIWELEPVTVRAIHERIIQLNDVGYTTVLKQIQRLTEKGVLGKEVLDGIHYYRSKVNEKAVKSNLAAKVLNAAFSGSAVQMMMHALGDSKPSEDELIALKQWLDGQLPNK